MIGYLSDGSAKGTPVCFKKQTGVFFVSIKEYLLILYKAHGIRLFLGDGEQ